VTRLAPVAWRLASLAVGILLVVLWQRIADARLIPAVFLPGPDKAWASLVGGFASGNMLSLLLATVLRMIYGWLLASLLGIAIGAAIGMSPRTRAYLGPTLELLRPLPAPAIIPLAVAFFGLSDAMVLGVIGFGALWPMLLATMHGFAAVEPRLYEVARTLGLSRLAVVFKIALPSSLPDILAGMRLGLTIALILAVVGEMLTGQDGLGTLILRAARAFRAADLFAGVILLGLLGYASAEALAFAESRLLRWRPRAR
jgi:ABC-type nitrate/sulfonate/bicarbonate transport system permease component